MYKLTINQTVFGFRAILNHDTREFWMDCQVFDAKTAKSAEAKARRFAAKVGFNVY